MKVTMDSEGWMVKDGGRRREDGGRRRRTAPVLGPLSSVLCLLVLLSGCDKQAVEDAQQEARQAKATVQQLKHSLGLAEKEIANMRAELDAVRIQRDGLQDQVKQANQQRDEALGLAEQAQEAITTQTSGQAAELATLQRQVAELTALVTEQQKLIEQLHKGAAVEPAPAAPIDETPVDPNEGL